MSWIDKYFAGIDLKALYGDTFGGLMLGLGLGGTVTPAPTVSSVTPDLGPSDSPTLVRVTGIGFVNGCVASFNGVNATTTVWKSSTLLWATTAAGTASATPGDCVVTNPDTQTGTLAASWTYFLPTMSGAFPGGSTIAAWWDPSVIAKCRQGTTSGSSQCTNGSNCGYVIDRNGVVDLAAAVGSSGSGLTPATEKYGTPDADNGLGYIQGPTTAGSQILISQASVTYDAVVMVIKSSHHIFPVNGGCILGAASTPRGFIELDTDFLQNTFVNFGNATRLTPSTANGQWYAEDGFSGAVDPDYSQVGGPDQWHVIAFKLNTPRSEYIDLLSDWGTSINFSIFDGRLGEVLLLNSSTDADIKEVMRYASAKWRSQYTNPMVYFDSDSLWSEGFLTLESQVVPVRTMAALSSAPQHPITNFDYQSLAIGGQTLEQMLARVSWNVVDKFPARSHNVVCFGEWLNSYLLGGGQSVAQVNAHYDSYLAAVHAAGGLAVAATPTFSGSETTSGQETDRQAIRSHILSSAADVVVDLGSPDGPFGQVVLGGPCNARWYADSPPKTHPTPDGALFLSNVIADGLGPLLATLNGTSPPGPVINLADPVNGGASTAVTFYGANIPNTLTGIDFGATPATSVVRTHSWRLDCMAPAGTGTVSVTFHFSDRADVVFASAFSYGSAPTVSSINKSLGDFSGGTVVQITVDDSTGATGATVCGVALTSFSIVDGTTVQGTTAAMTASATPGDVTVTNAIGTGTLAGAFEAFAPTNPTTTNACALRADLGVTLSGSNAVAWTDQGPDGNSFAQSTPADGPTVTSTINSKATLSSSVGAYWMRGPVFSLTAAHAFFVLKPTSAGYNVFWKFGGFVNPEFMPFSDETTDDYYPGFGSTTRKSALPLGLGTVGVCIEIISTSSEWTILVNGVQKYTTATNTVGWDSTGSLLFGTANNASDPPSPGQVDIAEVDIYAAKLSSGERTRVAAYILDRYGISI